MRNPEMAGYSPEQKSNLNQIAEILKKYWLGKSFSWIQQTNDTELHFMVKAKDENSAIAAQRELGGLGFSVQIEDGKIYLDVDFPSNQIDKIRDEFEIEDLRDKE